MASVDIHLTPIVTAGRFQLKEGDGKRSLIYIPMIVSSEPAMESGEASDILSQTLFLCPNARLKSALRSVSGDFVKLDSSPHFHGVGQQIESTHDNKRLDSYNHYVFPLFSCNNKSWSDKCGACNGGSKVSSDFYFCRKCDEMYHKECTESPLKISHPLHPKHPLQLCCDLTPLECFCCKEVIYGMGYHCTICKLRMHPTCAMEPVSCVIDQCKRHDHPLTFFTRRASLDCNVCGLTSDVLPTYVCLQCNFVAHGDCVDSPHVIRISRHHHRISFALSLQPGTQSCGVCRKEVNREYGGYTCNKCDDYVVHSRCALREDVWDGEELEGVPEEDDMEEVVEPYERISDGVILHFSHKHLLRLDTSIVYDESKICDACVIPIYKGDFYTCRECDFILHDTCANAPCKIIHPLHPHPLALQVINGNDDTGYVGCDACVCDSSGFIYECKKKGCQFKLDVRCASIYEPYDYQGHEHSLYLALDPAGETKSCQICPYSCGPLLNCIECDYIICFECVTLPYMARYKHDKHFLILGYGDETSKPDWCEVCEEELPSDREERFYTCNHCCTTVHIKCLLGRDMYMKPGHNINEYDVTDVKILPNNSLSRPTCDYCDSRCEDRIFYKQHDNTWCSLEHVRYT